MSIFSTTAAKADWLFKSIKYAIKLSATRRVVIRNSTIVGGIKNGCGDFRISLGEAIGKGLDLAFIYEADKLRQLDSFRNSKTNINIFDREAHFEVTDKQRSVMLWKCSATSSGTLFQDPSKFKPIGVQVTVKDLETVKKESRSTLPYVYLNVVEDQLISLKVPGASPHYFDPDSYDEKDDGDNMALKCLSFLMLPGKKANLKIAEMGGGYWLLAEIEMALGASLEIQEQLIKKRSNS